MYEIVHNVGDLLHYYEFVNGQHTPNLLMIGLVVNERITQVYSYLNIEDYRYEKSWKIQWHLTEYAKNLPWWDGNKVYSDLVNAKQTEWFDQFALDTFKKYKSYCERKTNDHTS